MAAAESRPSPHQGLPLVFYDGDCGMCHRTVNFLISRDPEASRFRFAPLGGETFLARVPSEARAGLPDSLVVLEPDGRLFTKSAASLRLFEKLGGAPSVFAACLGWIPRPVLDLGYDLIATIRRRILAAPVDACPVGTPELRARFDP